MNIEIVSKQPNALFGRSDVDFGVSYDAAVPSRKEVRSALSAALSIGEDRIVLVRLSTSSGVRSAKGLAHVYAKAEDALKDSKHLLIRDGLAQKDAKKAAAPAKKK